MKLPIPLLAGLLTVCLFSCTKEKAEQQQPVLNLTFSASPVPLNGISAKFAANVSYNNHPHSVFDVFLPASGSPTALVIFIHGGGFTGGDKSSAYDADVADNIPYYLQNNVAFITANYQLMQDDASQGLYTSLKDIKRCLQFIRYYAASLNIDKTKIVAYGGSAGGGASIWLGFHPDMADAAATDPVLRESTRLKAVGHSVSQATYDPVVGQQLFAAIGVNYSTIPGVDDQVKGAFVIQTPSQLTTDQRVIAMRADVDMLGLMTADDPEFYTQNNNPAQTPTSVSIANHVPLHAKTLYDKAQNIGLVCKANIPAYNINTTGGETLPAFMVRKVKQ